MQQAWLDANATENEPQFVALVGIDWADREHVWCWQAAGENKRETGGFAAKAGAVEAWVGDLVRRFGSGPIAVAIEQTRAALLWQLSKYEQLHLYVVSPQTSAQFRKTFYPSGAKDDPRDADLVLDLLVLHRRRLRRWAPDTPQTRLIQNLVEERRKLVNEKTAIINNLTNRLKLYFPQMLEWFNPIDTSLVFDLLERWPTLEQLQKLSSSGAASLLSPPSQPPGGLDRKPDQRDWPGAAGAERPCHPRCAGSGGSGAGAVIGQAARRHRKTGSANGTSRSRAS